MEFVKFGSLQWNTTGGFGNNCGVGGVKWVSGIPSGGAAVLRVPIWLRISQTQGEMIGQLG